MTEVNGYLLRCDVSCCRVWHLGNLIRVRGVVTRRTGVFPQLQLVKYDCSQCGNIMGPFAQNGDKEVKPAACPLCSSKGPFMVRLQSVRCVLHILLVDRYCMKPAKVCHLYIVSLLCHACQSNVTACRMHLRVAVLQHNMLMMQGGGHANHDAQVPFANQTGVASQLSKSNTATGQPYFWLHGHVTSLCIGWLQVNASETVYQNYQKLTLQESPGTVPAGRLPRHKEVILLNDLIDCARPGEEVEITGGWCLGCAIHAAAFVCC